MTPQRWSRIKVLFDEAFEREPSARADFLGRAAGDDPTLAEEVLGLLVSEERAGSFLSGVPSPSGIASTGRLPAPPPLLEGRRLGPYRLLAEVGHGGMGSVYRAVRDDDAYRKQVAVKLIRTGWDSGFVRERFRTERQILANLEHPNIARLIDGGTSEEGWPYLVMEHVEGEPIDHYCDTHALGTAPRLRLFCTVCSAVQHAHRSLVVHRDIKPGNILVTPEGTPKLLDFGIAKLLDPGGAAVGSPATLTGFPLMTPDYASPEQVRGEPITTASDVYSLGVLLYELLTGVRPYHLSGRSPGEILKAVCETEPVQPSLAARRRSDAVGASAGIRPRELEGDVDTIVMKALSKDPSGRYGSAQELSEDISRHLGGRPVRARKATLAYRAGKFVHRHAVAVAGASLAALGLLASTAVAVHQARAARAERARAEHRFNDVRKLADSFLFDFHDAIKDLAGSTPARELVVKKALEYLDSLAAEAQSDPALLRELAAAYQQVGDIQGNPYVANLGNMAGARSSYHKALEIRESLAGRGLDDVQDARDLAATYNRLGDILDVTGDTAASLASYRKALAISERVLPRVPGDVGLRRGIALAYTNIGHILATWSNDTAGSLDSYGKGLAIRKALLGENPASEDLQQEVISSYVNMGYELFESGDYAAALASQQSALALGQKMLAAHPTSARARRNVAVGYTNVADILRHRRDLAGAAEGYRKALVLDDALVAADPRDFRARRDLAIDHSRLGEILVEMRDGTGALAEHQAALGIREALSAANPSNAMARSALADSSFGIAKAHALLAGQAREGRSEHRRESCRWFRRSVDIWSELQAKGTLPGDDIAESKQAAAEVARCEATLAARR